MTTEIVGVDGNGFAPFRRREDLLAFVELDSGLDGRPAIDYDWDSVGSYLERYDGTVSVNVGTLVGNSALRIDALGWDDVPADERGDRPDARAPARLDGRRGRRALERARLPARQLRHDRGAGRATAEAGRSGGFYHSHVRYALGDRYLDPFREAIDIGRRAGAPATSPTSTTARRTRARPSRCSRSSTTPAPRASTSPSTPIRPNGPARGC